MSALFAMQINQVMLLLGIGLFVFALFNRIRRGWRQTGRPSRSGGSYRSGGASDLPSTRTREVIGSARLRFATASIDQESWEVDMHHLARQLKGEIDAKMRALERLIQMADEARAGLDAAMERAESIRLSAETKLAAPTLERRISESGGFDHRARRRGRAQAMRETVSCNQARGDEPGDDPRYERVYALADAGFSATKIAGQIGLQVGEVELILSLREQNKADAA